MSEFRPKLWTVLGTAVVAGSLGLAACSNEGQPSGEAGEGDTPTTVPAGEGEGEGGMGGEGEGEGGASGEAGAASAYAGVPAESRMALRLAHLEGFFRVALQAEPVEGAGAAAALAGQGLLEVYDPAKGEYDRAGVDEAVLRRAAETGAPADLRAALSQLEQARERAGGDPAAVVEGMAGIAAGLYRNVVVDGTVDPVEYQHSLGAALTAQAIAAETPALSSQRAALARLVSLWPAPVAPQDAAQATPYGELQAQVSRIELAL